MKSLAMAFAIYSKIPMPACSLQGKGMRYALGWLPAVGAVIGAVLLGWSWLCRILEGNPLFFAVGMTLLPVAISGGIHLDGFCDSCDALASHQPQQKKLEILKDSHAGAFAVIGCVGDLLLTVACYRQLGNSWPAVGVCALIPVVSRVLGATLALFLPAARRSGMLVAVTEPVEKRGAALLLAVFFTLAVTGMVFLCWFYALAVLFAAVMLFLWCRRLCLRQFGGVTGDLAGYAITLCELVCPLLLVVVHRVGEVL